MLPKQDQGWMIFGIGPEYAKMACYAAACVLRYSRIKNVQLILEQGDPTWKQYFPKEHPFELKHPRGVFYDQVLRLPNEKGFVYLNVS